MNLDANKKDGETKNVCVNIIVSCTPASSNLKVSRMRHFGGRKEERKEGKKEKRTYD